MVQCVASGNFIFMPPSLGLSASRRWNRPPWFAPQQYFDMYPNETVGMATNRFPPPHMPYEAFPNHTSLAKVDQTKPYVFQYNFTDSADGLDYQLDLLEDKMARPAFGSFGRIIFGC